MEILVNGKEMKLNFGIRFVQECNKRNKQVVNIAGIEQELVAGLKQYISRLLEFDATALIDVIECALWKYKGNYKREELYDWFDEQEDVDSLFLNVMEQLEEANATKKIVKMMTAEVKEREKQALKIQQQFMNE